MDLPLPETNRLGFLLVGLLGISPDLGFLRSGDFSNSGVDLHPPATNQVGISPGQVPGQEISQSQKEEDQS